MRRNQSVGALTVIDEVSVASAMVGSLRKSDGASSARVKE
jgi:hypothetical protein